MNQRSSTPSVFSTDMRTFITLIFIIIILPFLIYLLLLSYYYSARYLILTFTFVTDPRQLLVILYLGPVVAIIGLSMTLAYFGII
ncbi:MAG: hypothetical protein Barrevirus5_10 [Barrevirus sp.]|uniref:Uncharacterized protein n=1 Tax=Barrevirus sp. TaxID=2487763 RepID=A0A3G4ZSH3_9VIRU|nr:MAG: hypothetical protein Barrevirus5_10 [Barrevirus sp.]